MARPPGLLFTLHCPLPGSTSPPSMWFIKEGVRVCLASSLFLHTLFMVNPRQGALGRRGEAPTAPLSPAMALLEFTFPSTDQEM